MCKQGHTSGVWKHKVSLSYNVIQSVLGLSETNKKQNKTEKGRNGGVVGVVSSPSWTPPCIFCRGWAGGLTLNYMSRAQLSLSEDLPHGFSRFL